MGLPTGVEIKTPEPVKTEETPVPVTVPDVKPVITAAEVAPVLTEPVSTDSTDAAEVKT